MTLLVKRALTAVAWSLMALGPILGLWAVLDILSGGHTLGGPVDFVLRQWLTLLMTVLGPVAQGAVLLLAIRIYERLVEDRA
jgi:hypothetical protein